MFIAGKFSLDKHTLLQKWWSPHPCCKQSLQGSHTRSDRGHGEISTHLRAVGGLSAALHSCVTQLLLLGKSASRSWPGSSSTFAILTAIANTSSRAGPNRSQSSRRPSALWLLTRSETKKVMISQTFLKVFCLFSL